MSELIDNAQRRRDLLKHMILKLHEGVAVEEVRGQLSQLLREVPYDDVVAVEQELIAEGLPTEEILKLCDVHTEALQGMITTESAPEVEPGHPVHTFKRENAALLSQVAQLRSIFAKVGKLDADTVAPELMLELRGTLNNLADVEKHYLRKEYLIFPFLEAHEITGPPTVMWGKHDETREIMKGAFAALEELAGEGTVDREALQSIMDLVLEPLLQAIEGMVDKEEQILFPMCLKELEAAEWWKVYQQSVEFGFCLVDPEEWPRPADISDEDGQEATPSPTASSRINLPTGSFSIEELEAALNTIPFDVTFVDANDKVRYFSHGRERIFARNRAILGRDVKFCHPPSSVATVERILEAFHAGEKDHAQFWLELGGQFISVEYFAMKGKEGEFLGTLEVSQNLTKKRALTGEQRLLSWDEEE